MPNQDSHPHQAAASIQTATSVTFPRTPQPLNPSSSIWKSSLDRMLAAAGLVLLFPVMVAIGVAVRLQGPGPVVFRQRRIGLGGRPFVMFKFRTMRATEDGNWIRQASKDDERITPVGKILRRTSLDELPQLLNVLRGDMALVGPRPHAVAHDHYYAERIPGYTARHCVRPGITGWAQINGSRGETPDLRDMARRVEHDLYYITHWSPQLDAQILLKTIVLFFRPHPAAR